VYAVIVGVFKIHPTNQRFVGRSKIDHLSKIDHFFTPKIVIFTHFQSDISPYHDAINESKKALIKKVINGLQDGTYPSARKACKACEINYITIRKNIQIRTYSKEQKTVLKIYYDQYFYLETNPKKKYIRLAANSLFRADNSDRTVGKDWI